MFFSNLAHLPLVLIAAVISIVLHEVAHGYAALWNGDPTAKMNGRLTLNPFAHFDFFGLLMMVMVGFGFAKPVPVNPYNFRKQSLGVFTVAIAGVTVNFVLAFFSVGFIVLFSQVVYVEFLYFLFVYLAVINLGLMVFNLLPIYPLDGFRVVESFTYHTNKYNRFMRNYGFFILLGLIFLGYFIDHLVSLGLPSWVGYLDILGTLLVLVRTFILNGLLRFWCFIFGVPF